METTVYVDVLLVLNYIVSLLIILCTAKIAGILPQRRKIVAAALVGSLCSLTIFLPFMGFFYSIGSKLLVSAVMVRIALPWSGSRSFLGNWFVFFAVNFFFAGVMLAIWMMFAPRGMVYYNGVVYFHVSSLSLVITTVAAYLLLSLWGYISKSSRLQEQFCKVELYKNNHMCGLTGLMDTGNTLTEPFSGAPVMVCSLLDIQELLPEAVTKAIAAGDLSQDVLATQGFAMRLVPYSGVGGNGVLPAFVPDKLIIHTKNQSSRVLGAYVGVAKEKIGDVRYNAILNPEMTGQRLQSKPKVVV